MTSPKDITIYTDGACLGNPGPGGYGVVVRYGGHRKELSGGYRQTTNNRMELMAAIKGLELLNEPCRVGLFTDSEYVQKAMTLGWAARWEANGWQRNRREAAQNPDLWAQLLKLSRYHDVTFNWVRGHAGDRENERCDQLSVQAANGRSLEADEGYERR